MSKLNTPLLSFTARGQIAKTLVFSSWKGIPTVRGYTVPTNPRTVAQVEMRVAMSLVVNSWRYYFTDPAGRTAWSLRAETEPTPMAGYHSFVKNSVNLTRAGGNPSFVNTVSYAEGTDMPWLSMLNMDNTPGDEAGNFSLYSGLSHTALKLDYDTTIGGMMPNGFFHEITGYPPGSTVFHSVMKNGNWRAGIYKTTIPTP